MNSAPAPAQALVWVVEDSPLHLQHTVGLLAPLYRTEGFPTGEALLERLAHGVLPDLIVLDWQLPGVSGLEVCGFIRERFNEATLPVLMVTVKSERADFEQGLTAGANDYVAKPFSTIEFLARVRTLVRGRQEGRALEEREARLATTLTSIGDAVISCDVAGRVTFMNPVAERLTGWSEAEARGQPMPTVFHIINESSRKRVHSPVERVLREGIVVGLANHTLLVRKDGVEIHIDDSAAPIRDGRGGMTGVVLVFRDIGERKKAEAERERLLAQVQAEQAKLQQTFMQSPVAIAILDGPQHTFTLANAAYRALVNGRDVVGKPLLEALPDVRGQGFDALLDQVKATGVPFYAQERPVKLEHHQGDDELILNFTYTPMREGDGTLRSVLASVVDVTEQVLARRKVEALAAELQRSEERLRRVVAASGTGTWELDLATGVTTSDARHDALIGLAERPDGVWKSRLQTVHPEDRERLERAVRGAAAGEGGGRLLTEFRAGTPERWVELRGHAVPDASGQPTRIVGTSQDLTERKTAELALRFEQHKLQTLFRASPAVMALWHGPELTFELANPTFASLFGHRELVGKTLLGALPELNGQGFDALLLGVLQTGVPYIGHDMPAQVARADGGPVEEHFFDFSYLRVDGPNGQPYGVYCHAVDVTAQVLARRKVEALAAELKVEGSRKDEFLAMLAHELRNPMAAISMALTLMERPEDDAAKSAKYRATARRQLANLTRLVDDLLDVSRITRGMVELRKAEIDLGASVANAVAAARPGIEARRQSLSVSLSSGPFLLEADATRLEQVVANLLTNAAKYTEPGGALSVDLTSEEQEGASSAVLKVRDTGRGIPAEMLRSIFEMFVQVTPTIDRSLGGLGLGLTLVKRLVEMHGGTVEAHSEGAGKGSEFVVRLPIRPVPTAAAPSRPPSGESEARRAGGKRIVVVEDTEDAREMMKEFLEAIGHEVQVAVNGPEGVALVLEAQPDLALIDVGLPGLDGYEVARRIRADARGQKLFLAALTGYGGPEAQEKARTAGFDLHLTKPVDIMALQQLIAKPLARS